MRLRSLLACALASTLVAASAMATTDGVTLFTPSAVPLTDAESAILLRIRDRRGTKNASVIEINGEVMAADLVSVDVAGEHFSFVRTTDKEWMRVAGTWFGRYDAPDRKPSDGPAGSLTIARNGSIIIATIRLPHHTFTLHPLGQGSNRYVLMERGSARAPR